MEGRAPVVADSTARRLPPAAAAAAMIGMPPRLFDSKPLHAVAHRAESDAEQFCGRSPVVTRLFERLPDRLSLDLVGLPPSPAEVERFVNDPNSDAYEQLVELAILTHDDTAEIFPDGWQRFARRFSNC